MESENDIDILPVYLVYRCYIVLILLFLLSRTFLQNTLPEEKERKNSLFLGHFQFIGMK